MMLGRTAVPEHHASVTLLSLEVLSTVTNDDEEVWNMLDNVYKFIEDQCVVRSFYTVSY